MAQKIISVPQHEPHFQEELQKLLDDGWRVAHATPLHGYGYGSISGINGEVQYILEKVELV